MTGPQEAEAEARVQEILKAFVVGARVQDAASRAVEDDAEAAFTTAGALLPPYDQHALSLLVEHSNALRQNVDSYSTNIDGFGHRLEPPIDLEADDAAAKVADLIVLERSIARDAGTLFDGVAVTPSDEETAARLERLRLLARVERARLESFLDACVYDHSFVHLRRITRQDVEVTGNAYWEVLRTMAGDIARFVYVPSPTVRLLPLDREVTEVTERVRTLVVSLETVSSRRRLRRFVQIQAHGRECVYFKSFGDPRVVSRATGRVFPDVAALKAALPGDEPATELIHFAVHSPRSPYGVPRWIGTLLSVLGSRAMEETNFAYFDNKSVPPLALLVSGGRLSDASVPRIERFIEENLRGRQNFHKILVLEADGPGGSDSARAKITLQPLTSAQQADALFQEYDRANVDKVGSAFRLPRLLRGDVTDFNRSVAEVAMQFAEDQVFEPERTEFDHLINRRVLPDLGIRFWRFRSLSPGTRDPERLTDMVEKLIRTGVLTPEEGREIAADIFNRPFRKIGDDWVRRPITLTLAGIQTGTADVHAGQGAGTSVLDNAKRLIALREELRAEESRIAEGRLALARKYMDGEVEHIKVPSAEFQTWFGDPADEAA